MQEISSFRRRRRGWSLGLAALLAGLCFGLQAPASAAGTEGKVSAKPSSSTKLYDYYLLGNGGDVAPAAPDTPLLVLMGGGLDVDSAFKAMIDKAAGRSGKVDVVIIRVTGADGYNDYLYNQLYAQGEPNPIDSVETLVIKSRAGADDPTVNAIVAKADVLFIAGGDQWDYINLWKGSKLDSSLQALKARKVPIGGTSAGLAVLGDFDFSAQNGSITSDQALANPYDRRETLDTGFLTGLTGLANTITDSHLVTRDRMGRLLSFVARMVQDNGWSDGPTKARGIGLDEHTALVVDNGIATIHGSGTAYFVQPQLRGDVVQPKKPLSIRNVRIDKGLPGQASFDLLKWVCSGCASTISVDVFGGALTSNPY
jgi:cyanophycinase